MRATIAIFGEAERGNCQTAYFCRSQSQLLDTFGHPPENSWGLHYAIHLLSNENRVIFFRVPEEGFSESDYLEGLKFLYQYRGIQQLNAVCLPGVGSEEILSSTTPLCNLYGSLLIINEQDLYDFLTHTSHV